jgi:hypothetical protein
MKDNVQSDPAPSSRREIADERFRSVFMHMAEGVTLNEITFDAKGQPVNYRILDVNPQFEQVTGMRP